MVIYDQILKYIYLQQELPWLQAPALPTTLLQQLGRALHRQHV